MKKIKMNLIVALMFGTLISYATEKSNSTNSTEKKIVKVEFKNVKKGQTLTIKSANGVTIYSQAIESTGSFSKLFDFSALENGNYKAELNKDFEIIVKNFKVENNNVTFLKGDKKVYKPIVRTKGDLLYISKIAFNKKPLNIIIYYKDEVILSETIQGKDILKRIYKLSETEKGDYRIILNTQNRSYTKDFTI